MHVTIDMQNLLFLFKGSFDYCHLRGSIEATTNTKTVTVTASGLRSLTLYELQKLYQNTTGEKHLGYSYSHALDCCLQIATAMQAEPNTDLFNLQAQSDYVERQDPNGEHAYRYMPGAQMPIKLLEFPAPTGKRAEPLPPTYKPADGHEAHTATGVTRYQEPSTGDVVRVAIPTPRPATPRPQGERTAGPRGTVSQTIWAAADEAWERAGKPVTRDSVMRMRKELMDVLEAEHGIKRNSASNELGQWQKSRITV